MIFNKYRACWAAAGALALIGCVDTEGEFNAFQQRYETIHPPSMSSGAGGGCSMVPEPGKADGQFIFAFSASLDPASPVLFDTKLTTSMGASGLEMKLKFQPLAAADRKTPVGMPLELGPFQVKADGSFDADFPPLDVTGAANPISGSDITAKVELIGVLCLPADFICGDLKGNVTKPADLPLKGSTFAMERLAMPGVFPAQPKINCKGDLAKKL